MSRESTPTTATPSEISLCAIVRNESHSIRGMLLSVAGLVSEMVIVDTGSTDNSREIAASEGARVESFSWSDDFSAARNYSVALATKPWILVLDADERLDPSALPIIRQLISKERSAFTATRRHYVATPTEWGDTLPLSQDDPARASGATAYFSTHDIRLFPKDPSITFSGAVHESPEDSIRQAGLAFPRAEITIHHYGHLKSASDRQKKAEFYLSLAEKKALASPDDWRTWYHLAVEQQALGRHTDAISNFRRAIDLIDDFAPLWRQLGVSLYESGDLPGGLTAIRRAFEINDTCLITWGVLGQALLAVGDIDGAEACFKTILAQVSDSHVALRGIAEVAKCRTKL
jgi:glycosyltransferase involved in cell wall biosynthesis